MSAVILTHQRPQVMTQSSLNGVVVWAPLGMDAIVPASINRRNYRKYASSSAVTDFREFAGRSDWIIAQNGWQEVAGFIADWLASKPIS